LHAKQASKRKRRSKAVPVLGAAGLLALASGAVAQAAGPAANLPTRTIEPSHELTLGEEEVFDVSLATFYVFDRENSALASRGFQLVRGGCGHGCGGGGCRGCGGCHAMGGCGGFHAMGCGGGGCFRGCRGCRGCGCFGGCGGCGGVWWGGAAAAVYHGARASSARPHIAWAPIAMAFVLVGVTSPGATLGVVVLAVILGAQW
jgi:hypothetical protein